MKERALKTKNAGFSLVELMVVLSVLSLVIVSSISASEKVRQRAKQAEAKMNVRSVTALVHSYVSEDNTLSTGIALTTGSFVTTDSCNNGNVIGFAVTDCQKQSYRYFASGANTEQITGIAVEQRDSNGNKSVFPKCASQDIWLAEPTAI